MTLDDTLDDYKDVDAYLLDLLCIIFACLLSGDNLDMLMLAKRLPS